VNDDDRWDLSCRRELDQSWSLQVVVPCFEARLRGQERLSNYLQHLLLPLTSQYLSHIPKTTPTNPKPTINQFATMPPTLAPFNPPLGPQPPSTKLYHPQQVTLALKEKIFSLSGDDFTVKTAEGLDICKVKGKAISLRDTKKFSDMQGHELFSLTNKMLAITKSFHGTSPDGKHDFEVAGKFKLMGSKSVVTFKNASDGKEVELVVKGDWMDRSAEITYMDKPVAVISRKFFNASQFFGDKQTVRFYLIRNKNC